jgi:hypothetical protein
MAIPIRPFLAIGLTTAGIGVAPIVAAPVATAAPRTSGTTNTTSSHNGPYDAARRQLVRNSAKATPTGGYTAGSEASKVTTSRRQSSTGSTTKSAPSVGVPPARPRHRQQPRRRQPPHRRPPRIQHRRRTRGCCPRTEACRVPSSITRARITAVAGSCNRAPRPDCRSSG